MTGGAASGESGYAENLVMEWEGPRYYLATMSSLDYESQVRIDRHLASRADKGFITLDLEQAGMQSSLDMLREQPGTVLLEDLGNLVGCLFHGIRGMPCDMQSVFAQVMEFVEALMACSENLVIVCSAVGGDGITHDARTDAFVALLGRVSCSVAALCDSVVEVVYEQPIFVKGNIDGLSRGPME